MMSSPNEKSPLVCFEGDHCPRGSIQKYTPLGGAVNNQSGSVAVSSRVRSTNEDRELPIPRAVFVVTNAALGRGMLEFPLAFRKTVAWHRVWLLKQ